MENFVKIMKQMSTAISGCISNDLGLPALTLIYCSIDIVSYLNKEDDEGNKAYFTKWVDIYLIPKLEGDVTSIDIYASRCGIVHRMSSESDLSSKGKARQIVYTMGKKAINIQDQIDKNDKEHLYTTLHIDELFDAFMQAVEKFRSDLIKNDEKKVIAVKRAKRVYGYCNVDKDQEYDITIT
ncbi:hypothetical protein LZ24_01137 [Desulfobotulus alkaliphilus]|uniref:Uncharacterized protein n=1 Tax=Desulfobotulus alkaliphilus TaxID=622671 RepID=A0A562RYK7_9BACT|nr:hypothetical protein [Desulfobotulus alkaliphilus]TWI74197.1 hypothetical protein LZ24_01137 [Desulfobotulus alkaliphilus]